MNYPKLKVSVTNIGEFKAVIKESRFGIPHEIIVGGDDWRHGKYLKYHDRIIEKCEKITNHLNKEMDNIRAIKRGFEPITHVSCSQGIEKDRATIIEVKCPTFFYNKNNPKEVKYNPEECTSSNYVNIQVGFHGSLELRSGDIYYKYKDRGYILRG